MRTVREVASVTAEAAAPRGDIIRLRFRDELDKLLTGAVAVLAIGLAVSYQVLSRIGPDRTAGPR